MHLLLVSSVIKFNLVLSTLPTLPIPMQISLCVCESRSVISNSLPPHGLYSHGILQARMLEWVAFLFSRGSSQTKDWTQVSCIAGGFFTNWAIREAQHHLWLVTPLVTCYLFICLNVAYPGHCPRLPHMRLLILFNSWNTIPE